MVCYIFNENIFYTVLETFLYWSNPFFITVLSATAAICSVLTSYSLKWRPMPAERVPHKACSLGASSTPPQGSSPCSAKANPRVTSTAWNQASNFFQQCSWNPQVRRCCRSSWGALPLPCRWVQLSCKTVRSTWYRRCHRGWGCRSFNPTNGVVCPTLPSESTLSNFQISEAGPCWPRTLYRCWLCIYLKKTGPLMFWSLLRTTSFSIFTRILLLCTAPCVSRVTTEQRTLCVITWTRNNFCTPSSHCTCRVLSGWASITSSLLST